MVVIKLTFEKMKSNDGLTEQVYPIVTDSSKKALAEKWFISGGIDEIEIGNVVSCNVASICEGLTQMTLIVNIRNDKNGD